MINYQKVWATLDLDERIAFRDMTIKAVQEIYPHYIVRPLDPKDADRFFVGNKQDNVRVKVRLRNLFARFSMTGRSSADLKDAIFDEYSGMLNMAEDSSVALDPREFTWNDVREYARPQFMRAVEVENKDKKCLQYPFGDEVVTAMIFDMPQDDVLYWITPEMLDGWGKTEQELYTEAMDNLVDLADGLDLVGTRTPRTALWNKDGPSWSSTCILIPEMRRTIADTIGSPFRFGIPSRHLVYSWIDIQDENYQVEMKATMEREKERLPAPLTSKIFEVDTNGQIQLVKPQPEIPPVPMISNN